MATGPAPLPAATLAEIGKSIALIQIPGSNDVPGVLLAGGPASRGRHSYLILGAVPANLEQAVVAYASDTGVQTWSAKRRATLPSGVAIFGFTSKSALSVHEPSPAVAGETFHGLQLRGEGSLPDTEQASLTTELESLSAQVKTSQEALNEARRMQMAPNMMGGNPQRGRPDLAAMEARRAAIEAERTSQRDEARATGALAARQAELSARLKFPVLSVTPVEVATGVTIEALEQKAGYLNHALLATSAGKVRAIRRQQQWLNVDDLIASVPHDVQQVKLSVSGNRSSARVTCEITPAIFDGQTGYSLVAATTFALETQGSGTLEQRLAGVTPVPFQGRGAIQTAQTEAAWNANKTTLWIKVFSDQEPDKPVIDEAILLDYPESFSARWAKPPSPLIVKPTPTPDSPADLVRGSQVLDAKGEIRDLVAAGDGSVVVVRTAAAPFWAALDLKSGEWLKVPWTATEDTLVAAQAGKIYLIDRRTHIVDIRELADGKRVGMQLLPVDGMVTAVAAPLSATDRPLLVATDKELVFIDPTAFERVPSGLNAESIFAGADARNYHYEPLVPASICLRASQDGSTYTISGTAARNPGRGVATLRVTLDPTAMVAAVNSEQRILPTRGRNLGRNLPDHAGSGLFLTASGNGGNFPNAPGKISIGDESSSELAVLNNPPLIPPRPDRPGDVLPPDRGAYFDSAAGVILFPDGANLHLVRLNFTAPAASPPEYVFAGEVVEIPLPPGSGHQFTSSIGGATEISAESARWTVPENASSNSARLRLDWTGELGSRIGKDYQVQVMKKEAPWVAESSDGSRQLVLHRRLVLPQIRSGSPKFAGSGHVLLMDDSDCGAWNLVTGEKLFSRDDFRGKLMGDADRIYLRDGGGKLTSYDIATGR
ncbi:MAG: hypothetical protein ABIT37_01940, partial [Luteolibacter sp.]